MKLPKLPSLKLFKGIKKFVANKAEAKELKRVNAKANEMKLYAVAMKELLKTGGITLPDTAEIGGYNSEEQGANVPVYFYDFLKEWNNGGNFVMGGTLSATTSGSSLTTISFGSDMDGMSDPAPDTPMPTPTRIAISEDIEAVTPKVIIKPIDVYHELEKLPNAVSLENLEEKIITFKMREKFIRYNDYAKKEVIDMCLRLENRRKYEQFKEFFEQFDYTTTEKVNALISKYGLLLKSSDLFIPTFPKEAVEIMDKYQEKVIELCNKKPVFYVIAESDKFKKEFDRNDPILLVQSPFGVYWQILGAWDKEILLLEEL